MLAEEFELLDVKERAFLKVGEALRTYSMHHKGQLISLHMAFLYQMFWS